MSTERVMLLIDADNVSVDVMEQAVELLLDAHGALHVRRAYCTAESALKHQTTFKRLGIKPMVNLAAGKNSTDIAMAVDAIDLVIAERPDVVAIASSDSDFAPLVQRLREKGCRVVGIGQEGKTGDETISVYDAFTVFAHRRGRVATAAPARGAQRGQRAGARGGAGQRSAAPARQPAAAARPPAAPAAVPAAAAAEVQLEAAPVAAPADETAAAPAPAERAPRRRRSSRRDMAAEAAESAAATAPEASVETPAAVEPLPAEVPSAAADAPGEAAAETPAEAPAEPAAPRRTPRRRKTAAEAPAAPEAAEASVDTQPPPPEAPEARPSRRQAPAAKKAAARPAPAAAPAPIASYPDEIRQILAALPELVRGETVELRLASERLRDADLLGPRGSSTRFFAPYADRFELLPPGQPNKVRLRPPGG